MNYSEVNVELPDKLCHEAEKLAIKEGKTVPEWISQVVEREWAACSPEEKAELLDRFFGPRKNEKEES